VKFVQFILHTHAGNLHSGNPTYSHRSDATTYVKCCILIRLKWTPNSVSNHTFTSRSKKKKIIKAFSRDDL